MSYLVRFWVEDVDGRVLFSNVNRYEDRRTALYAVEYFKGKGLNAELEED